MLKGCSASPAWQLHFFHFNIYFSFGQEIVVDLTNSTV